MQLASDRVRGGAITARNDRELGATKFKSVPAATVGTMLLNPNYEDKGPVWEKKKT